jgi:ABC-type Fe3+-hydroxamate transport system substrate-binding protein
VNKAGLTTLGEGGKLDKEFFYEVNPDLILSDPNRFIYQNVEVKDIDEIIENVAPFVGCRGRRYWSEESRYKWPDGEPYRYYSLREHLEMYGQAFQEQERAEAMSELHRATIEDITSRVPRSGDRPEIGLIWHDPSTQEFWVYNLESKNKKTWGKKHYRDLNVKDAFAGIFDGESSVVVDYEVVLEHDPDKLFFNFGISANEEMAEKAFEEMPEDSVGSQLTAVQNDQLYKGGTAYQGPIINLFQTEMLAKQLYPEEFGEWQGIGETPEEEQLFDRQRIADIINGDI